jgi:dCMP deaminase
LTGRNASGKGVVAEFLRAKGFSYQSLSDSIREEVAKRGHEVTRERLIEVGRDLRARFGNGYLARQILKQLAEDRNYVVDSFRHPDEVEEFRNRSDFYLLALEAEAKTRYQRIKARARESDPVEFEDFLRLEEQEISSKQSEGQKLSETAGLADFTLENDGTKEELCSQVGVWLQKLMPELRRPDWDEYFMRMAKVAALRSNCVKRKVAAVIVRDKRVISTGYNGTPRGTRNCFEGGCPRCNQWAESGTQLDDCLCSHGEENAITQAAYHGVSVKDGVLYTTFSPCLTCTKMIINSGLREVVYNLEYPLSDTSFHLLQEAGLVCRQFKVD